MSPPREPALRSLPLAAALIWRAGRWQATALVGSAVALGLTPVVAAWLVKLLVDRIAAGEDQLAPLLAIVGGLAATTFAMLLIPALTAYLRAELERRVAVLVNRRVFGAVNRLSGLQPFEDPAFHNELRMAQQAGESAPPVVLSVGVSAIEEAVTLVGFVGALLIVSPVVALLALGAVVPGLVVERRLSRQQAELAFRLSPHDRRKLFYGALQTDERAAKEIRLFGLGDHFLARMLREFRTLNDGLRRMDRVVLRRQLAVGVLTGLLGAAALLLVAERAASGAVSVGDVFVVVAAIAGVQAAAAGLVRSAGQILESLLLLDHLRRLLRHADTLPATGGRECAPLREAIELDDVWFRYSPAHPWVLRGVSLRIPVGESLAIVGLNGAGKSTLVKLLCRFYDPERGALRWDGVDLRELDDASLRRRIATVFQDFMAYDLSAAENVALGDVARLEDRAAIRDASERAGLDHVLEGLPRGYDTMLSRVFASDAGDDDAGVDLSGGQWQRIAVARMLMRPDPDLLILDEPSAGLDADAEHEIHQRLLARRAGETSVLISHRLNAVAMADAIVVLAGGRIVESGRHAELLAADGEYARLFRLQASGYLSAPS